MSDDFDFADVPPAAAKARISKVPIGKTQYILLGPGRGLWLHWMGKRTIPCDGPRCPTGTHRRPAHWTSYFPAALIRRVLNQNTGKHKHEFEICVLTVNEEQAAELNSCAFPVVVNVEKRKGERGIRIHKIEPVAESNGVPSPFPVEPTLYKIFGRRPSSKGGDVNAE